jgi:Zn-dependent peptidase ImmA (M78 family)/transcriptional regulator with XRE-family HTH domain
MRVEVKPELLRWARERAGLSLDALLGRFPRLDAWERGEVHPTLKQLEELASVTHTPVGYLFLPEPPVELVPIPDFRTVGNQRLGQPSPDLLETIYICQQRQDWYRDFARSNGAAPLAFVGSVRLTGDVETVAADLRSALGLDLEERRQFPNWDVALRRFFEQVDTLGVLVMVNGVVGCNTHRKLDPEEFRGFALADDLAPLVFVNGADTKAAQMFTLAHELAHIWLGRSALSDAAPVTAPSHEVEIWCNRVAAELLVPLAALRNEYQRDTELWAEVRRLARCFKVSTLVILRRIYDAGGLTRDELWAAYRQELERLRKVAKGGGGNFYLTQAHRVGKRFSRALVTRTLEGQTLYRDALYLLGFSKISTFQELGRNVGVEAA